MSENVMRILDSIKFVIVEVIIDNIDYLKRYQNSNAWASF